MCAAVARVWQNLVAFGFELLYNELSWLYDPISWIASLGLWREWQSAFWTHLPPDGRILEIGSGPGHVLVDLLSGGYRSVGLDLSPGMLQLARKRLRRQGFASTLCRGRATALPFTGQAFSAVVCTFPTAFVYDLAWIKEISRVLQTDGKLLVVERASFSGQTLCRRCLEWLYRVTGQRDPAPELARLLTRAGLATWSEKVEIDGSTVVLVLAVKCVNQQAQSN